MAIKQGIEGQTRDQRQGDFGDNSRSENWRWPQILVISSGPGTGVGGVAKLVPARSAGLGKLNATAAAKMHSENCYKASLLMRTLVKPWGSTSSTVVELDLVCSRSRVFVFIFPKFSVVEIEQIFALYTLLGKLGLECMSFGSFRTAMGFGNC